MKSMGKRALTFLFAVLTYIVLLVPVQATEQSGAPITWLPMEMNGQPCTYNQELGWIRILEWDAEAQIYCNHVIDKETLEKVPGISYISEFSEELACVGNDSLDDPKYGFVDKNGAIAIPLEYDWAEDFSDGLALVAKKISDDDFKYGFIDKEGREVIPPQYDYAESFSEGLAVVGMGAVNDCKFGFVDLTGKIIIPLEYDGTARFQVEYNGAAGFENGVAVVYKVDDKGIQRFGIIDQANTEIAPLEYIAISRGSGSLTDVVLSDVYLVCKGDRLDRLADGILDFGVFNVTAGSEVVASEDYSAISRFSDGMAVVLKQSGDDNWEYGYIDTMGKLVIPLKSCGLDGLFHFSASGFSEGLALVGMLDDSGRETTSIINKDGKTVAFLYDTWPNISADEYDSAPSFSEGLAGVSRIDADGNRKYGYIDKTGVIKIPFEYDGITNFSDSLALVSKLDDHGESKYGYINNTGEVIIPIQYDDVGILDNIGWVKKGISYGIFDIPCGEDTFEILENSEEISPAVPVEVALGVQEDINEIPFITSAALGAIVIIVVLVAAIIIFLKKTRNATKTMSATKSTTTTMLCPNCGMPTSPGAKFCEKCGCPLEKDTFIDEGKR